MDRQAEYIALLQERNRLKKSIRSKSKQELDLEDRERGFSAHFSGANANPTKVLVANRANKDKVVITPTWRIQSASSSSAQQANDVNTPQKLLDDIESLSPSFGKEDKSFSSSKPKQSKGWASKPPISLLGIQVNPQSSKVIVHSFSYESNDSKNIETRIIGNNCQTVDLACKMGELPVRQSYESTDTDIYCEDFEAFSDNSEDIAVSSPKAPVTARNSFDNRDRIFEDVEDFEYFNYESDNQHDTAQLAHTVQHDVPVPINTTIMAPTLSPDKKISTDVEVIDYTEIESLSSGFDSFQRKSPKGKSFQALSGAKTMLSPRSPNKITLSSDNKEQLSISFHSKLQNHSPLIFSPKRSDKKLSMASLSPHSDAKDFRIYSPAKSRDLMREFNETSGGNKEVSNKSYDSHEILIRIKILSTWTKSKYASLSCLILHQQSDINEIKNDTANILHNFRCKILNGLEFLPFAHECQRSINKVTQSDKLHRKAFPTDEKMLWRGPLSNECPLELNFSGNIPNSTSSKDSSLDELSTLQLIIVNGWGANSCKDVDVYFGNKCLWSGTLPDTSKFVDRVSLPTFIKDAASDLAWSKVLNLISQESSNISSTQGYNTFRSKSSALDPSSFDLKTTFSLNLDSEDVVEPDMQPEAPIWLTRQPKGQEPTLLPSAKPNVDKFSDQDVDDDIEIIKNRRLSLRKSRASNATKEDPGLISQVEQMTANLIRPGRRNRIDESKVMASIDAISNAEKSNLGRLNTSGTLLTPGDSISLSNSNSKLNIDSISPTPHASSNTTIITATRSQRIDEVSRRVGKALDDISHVVSAIDVGPAIFPAKTIALPGPKLLKTLSIDSPHVIADLDSIQGAPSSLTDSSTLNYDIKRHPLETSSLINQEISLAESFDDCVSLDQKSDSSDLTPFKSSFDTPTLPIGTVLIMEIYSNWGDQFYLGLNGIEIFDGRGNFIWSENGEMKSVTNITADTNGMSTQPEFANDPRVVANLIDGSNYTKDDLHVWLTPIQTSYIGSTSLDEPIATISITFAKPTTLSMLRIFNYNKSRTHVQRGVRFCKVCLDQSLIFQGEIRMSNGELISANDCSEVILFTVDDRILRRIADHDEKSGYFTQDSSNEWVQKLRGQLRSERPSTGDIEAIKIANSGSNISRSIASRLSISPEAFSSKKDDSASQNTKDPLIESRNLTYGNLLDQLSEALAGEDDLIIESKSSQVLRGQAERNPGRSKETRSYSNTNGSTTTNIRLGQCVTGQTLSVIIHSTWGDSEFVGLAGLELLEGESLSPMSSQLIDIKAEPFSMAAIGFDDDLRLPKNVLNGVNEVTDDRYMWLVPYIKGAKHFIQFNCRKQRNFAGIRIWNYNKYGEFVLRGVKDISIEIDNIIVAKAICRLAPGVDGVSFPQTILFYQATLPGILTLPGVAIQTHDTYTTKQPYVKYISPPIKQDYEVPLNLSGMLWKFTIYDNWGDEYYVGLDSIQFLDAKGTIIDIIAAGALITAIPYSVSDLSACANDTRNPTTIFQADKSALSDNGSTVSEAWLAPLSRSMTSEERTVSVSRVLHQQRPRLDSQFSRAFDDYKNSISSGRVEQTNQPPDNVIFVMFPYPITISAIKIFNYSKTPDRGVKEIGLAVDDRLVFMGNLNTHVPADQQKQFQLERNHQSIVFTNDPRIIRNEKDHITYCGSVEQDVLYINERQVMVRSKDMYNRRPSVAAEGVYVDIAKR